MESGRSTKMTCFMAVLSVVLLLEGCVSPGPSEDTQSQASPATPPATGSPATPEAMGEIVRLDPAFDRIVATGAVVEKVADGFGFTEGPIWAPDGTLLFSDMGADTIFRVTPSGESSEFLRLVGPAEAVRPNGITLDEEGRLLICEMGNRRIIRVDDDGQIAVIADTYQGQRLNSPNDLALKSDGSIYFTDPPYGLPEQDDDPNKELEFNGIYRIVNGEVELLNTEMSRPNGITFSPDEQYLYVANSDTDQMLWMRFEVRPDGTLGAGSVFYDASMETTQGLPDGLKTDSAGNVYATGPGGVFVLSPEGVLLGKIEPPEVPANVAWGDDGQTLYMTARTSIYRIRLSASGSLL